MLNVSGGSFRALHPAGVVQIIGLLYQRLCILKNQHARLPYWSSQMTG
jgi:hypothetical protein